VITGAAICPAAPLLARELTGRDPVIPERRQACAAAVARLVRSGPEVIAVVGPAHRTATWPADGRPGWQVLAGAMPGRGTAAEVFYSDAPFGVFYLVARLAGSARGSG
jgi:hypothetical protein